MQDKKLFLNNIYKINIILHIFIGKVFNILLKLLEI